MSDENSLNITNSNEINFDADNSNGDINEINFDEDNSNGDVNEINFDADNSNGDINETNFDADNSNGDVNEINFDVDNSNGDVNEINFDADNSNGDINKTNFYADNKKLDLFIPLGTGFDGSEEGSKALAKSLFYLIKELNPKRIDFFVTELSRKTTLIYLNELGEAEYGRRFKRMTYTHTIKDIDNFEDIYNTITKEIKNLRKKFNIKIDYTSGTKTMTMAACIAATVNHLELLFVSGDRGSNTIVQSGSEFVKVQNLNDVFKDQLFNEIKDLFNNHRFNQGIEKLNSITIGNDFNPVLDSMAFDEDNDLYYKKLAFDILFLCYKHFDDFNHHEAFEIFNTGLYIDFDEFQYQLKLNYKSLEILNNKNHEDYSFYLIGSLYNNALRRAEEGKYDDAIARLYHCIEIITDVALKEHGINPKNVILDNIPLLTSTKRNKLKKLMHPYNGVYTITTIITRFLFLYHLNYVDGVGATYNKNYKEYNNILNSRHVSILAHGIEVKTFEEFLKFKDMVFIIFKSLTSDSEQILKETKFPKFRL